MTKSKLELEQRRELMKLHHKQRKIENRMSSEYLTNTAFKKLNRLWDNLEAKKQEIKGVDIFQ